MWPAIIRTVRRGAPGTAALPSSGVKCSKRKTVTRLLVLHAASSISRWSSADFITSLHKNLRVSQHAHSPGGPRPALPALLLHSDPFKLCEKHARLSIARIGGTHPKVLGDLNCGTLHPLRLVICPR